MSEATSSLRRDGKAVENNSGISPLVLWRAVRKRWVLILVVTLAVASAVTFYTLGQVKIYRAGATIQIDPSVPQPLGRDVQGVVDVGAGAYWSNREYYETQFKIIQSRRIAEETVRALGLHRDMGFVQNLPPGSSPANGEVSVETAAQILQGRLAVDPEENSRIVFISLEDADPRRAQRVLTALIDTYIQSNLDDAISSTGNASEWLKSQLEKLKKELERNELALHKYKKGNGILSVSFDDQSNMLRAELAQLNAELTRVRAKIQEIAARASELAKIDADDPATLPASELLNSAVLGQLRSAYVEAKQAHDSLVAQGRGEEHPEVRAARVRVDTARQALSAEVRNIKGAVLNDLAATRAEAKGLSKLFEAAKKRALELNRLEIDYNRLARSKHNTEKLYSVVLERSKESDLTGMLRFNNIKVIDSPLLPAAPVRPVLSTSLTFGLVSGLLLGVALALSRELLDRTIKSQEDLEAEVPFSSIGVLPWISHEGGSKQERKLNASIGERPLELFMHFRPSSHLSEAVRTIRTNIRFMSPDKPHRRLLVTSAGPGEGKTTVACSLAIAIAHAGQTVLLLDCDLRRPRLGKIFGVPSEFGVSQAVLDQAVLDHCRSQTEIPNLDVMAAGALAPSPAELLQSESFGRLLDTLEQRYDCLILDSPPLMPVADAAILSAQVDGCVVVVRAGKTPRELARRAAGTLLGVGAKVVGTVLNAIDLKSPGYLYRGYPAYYARESEPRSARFSKRA